MAPSSSDPQDHLRYNVDGRTFDHYEDFQRYINERRTAPAPEVQPQQNARLGALSDLEHHANQDTPSGRSARSLLEEIQRYEYQQIQRRAERLISPQEIGAVWNGTDLPPATTSNTTSSGYTVASTNMYAYQNARIAGHNSGRWYAIDPGALAGAQLQQVVVDETVADFYDHRQPQRRERAQTDVAFLNARAMDRMKRKQRGSTLDRVRNILNADLGSV